MTSPCPNAGLSPLDSSYVWRFEEDNFVHGWCIEESGKRLRIGNRLQTAVRNDEQIVLHNLVNEHNSPRLR